MRQRVVRVAVVAVVVALVLLAVPLAWGIERSFFADERGELERDALAASVRVGPQFASGDEVELPASERDTRVGVYDLNLRLRSGRGPADQDPLLRKAATGVVSQRQSDGELVVAVPVSSSELVIGVVRASTSTAVVWRRVLIAWSGLAAVAAAALAVGVVVARRQARRLSAPLEALSAVARTVAAGDLTARARDSGIGEIDDVARTQNAMVVRLASVLAHERRFTANASHQLRTPLTGLQLGLESAMVGPEQDLRQAVAEALRRTQHLERTVEEVLALSRHSPGTRGPTAWEPLQRCLEDLEQRWHGLLALEGRRLSVLAEPPAVERLVVRRALDQVLDVLVENARLHGNGTITVRARDLAGAAAIDVIDEGALVGDSRDLFDRGVSGGDGEGIGLSLARDLTEALGGRLSAANADPTTFTVLLPGDRSDDGVSVGP